MERIRAFRIACAVAFACAFLILVATFLVAPNENDIKRVREETGIFRYYRGHVGGTAYSTLNGRGLLCGASIVGTYSQCPVARDGESVIVTFVRVPTLLRKYEVAISVVGKESPPYQLTPSQLADDWLSRSYWDAGFYSFLAGHFAFAIASTCGTWLNATLWRVVRNLRYLRQAAEPWRSRSK